MHYPYYHPLLGIRHQKWNQKTMQKMTACPLGKRSQPSIYQKAIDKLLTGITLKVILEESHIALFNIIFQEASISGISCSSNRQ